MNPKCGLCGKRHAHSFRKCVRGMLKRLYTKAIRIRDKGVFNTVCQFCGKELTDGEVMHPHHIVRQSQDVRLQSDLANIVAAHSGCHSMHHNDEFLMHEWLNGFEKTHPHRWAWIQHRRIVNKGLGTVPRQWYRDRVTELERFISQEGRAPWRICDV